MATAPLHSTGHPPRLTCVVRRSSRRVSRAPDRPRCDTRSCHRLLSNIACPISGSHSGTAMITRASPSPATLAPHPPEAGKLTGGWLAPCLRGRYASRPPTDGQGRACQAPVRHRPAREPSSASSTRKTPPSPRVAGTPRCAVDAVSWAYIGACAHGSRRTSTLAGPGHGRGRLIRFAVV